MMQVHYLCAERPPMAAAVSRLWASRKTDMFCHRLHSADVDTCIVARGQSQSGDGSFAVAVHGF